MNADDLSGLSQYRLGVGRERAHSATGEQDPELVVPGLGSRYVCQVPVTNPTPVLRVQPLEERSWPSRCPPQLEAAGTPLRCTGPRLANGTVAMHESSGAVVRSGADPEPAERLEPLLSVHHDELGPPGSGITPQPQLEERSACRVIRAKGLHEVSEPTTRHLL